MPIYKQKNLKTKVKQTVEINYHDGDKHLAKESIVVHFGTGDIAICTGTSRNDFSDEILFIHDTPHPIGEDTTESFNYKKCFPPVRLLFDRVESIFL